MREFEGTLRLQGIGIVEGIKAINLKVGDERVFNYGGTEKIIRIESNKTGKSVIVTCEYLNTHAKLENGKWVSEIQEDIRTIRNDTIIAVKELNPVQKEIIEVETSIVEEIKIETENIIQATKNQEPLEALESIKNQLEKVTDTINNKININDELVRLPLRDIENNLKYNYCGIFEMMKTKDLEIDIEEPKQENIINKLENLINDSFDLNKTTDSEEQRASIRLYFKRLLATNKYTQCILSVYKDSDINMDFNNGFTIPLNFKLHEDREKVLKSIRNAISQFHIVKIKLV